VKRRRFLHLLSFVGLGPAMGVAVVPAHAQQWPAGPVKVIVPYGPGSTPDIVARIVSEHLTTRLGKPFVVENKPGASGNIGTDAVAKAAPDGQTIGISIAGPLAVNTLLFRNMPYDPARDIAPITIAATQPSVLRWAPAAFRISRSRRSPRAREPRSFTFPTPVRRRLRWRS